MDSNILLNMFGTSKRIDKQMTIGPLIYYRNTSTHIRNMDTFYNNLIFVDLGIRHFDLFWNLVDRQIWKSKNNKSLTKQRNSQRTTNYNNNKTNKIEKRNTKKHLFSNEGIPSTPQHTDPHPCTRPRWSQVVCLLRPSTAIQLMSAMNNR